MCSVGVGIALTLTTLTLGECSSDASSREGSQTIVKRFFRILAIALHAPVAFIAAAVAVRIATASWSR